MFKSQLKVCSMFSMFLNSFKCFNAYVWYFWSKRQVEFTFLDLTSLFHLETENILKYLRFAYVLKKFLLFEKLTKIDKITTLKHWSQNWNIEVKIETLKSKLKHWSQNWNIEVKIETLKVNIESLIESNSMLKFSVTLTLHWVSMFLFDIENIESMSMSVQILNWLGYVRLLGNPISTLVISKLVPHIIRST